MHVAHIKSQYHLALEERYELPELLKSACVPTSHFISLNTDGSTYQPLLMLKAYPLHRPCES